MMEEHEAHQKIESIATPFSWQTNYSGTNGNKVSQMMSTQPQNSAMLTSATDNDASLVSNSIRSELSFEDIGCSRFLVSLPEETEGNIKIDKSAKLFTQPQFCSSLFVYLFKNAILC